MLLDVLSLLKQCFLRNKHSIISSQDGQFISLGDLELPKDAKTNYLVWRTAQDEEDKSYYSLDSIVYLLKNSNLPHTIYVRNAMENGIPVIRRPDRKDLLSFLNGEIDSSSSIDKDIEFDIDITQQNAEESKDQMKNHNDPRFNDNFNETSIMTNLDVSLPLSSTNINHKNIQISQIHDKMQANDEYHKQSALSIDKIASLKAKFQKQKQIQKNNEIISSSIKNDDFDSTNDLKRSIQTNFRNILTKIMNNRSTITSSNQIKDFNKSLSSIISSFKQKEAQNSSDISLSSSSRSQMKSKHQNINNNDKFIQNKSQFKPQSGYNRYDQEKFTKNDELMKLGIISHVNKSSKTIENDFNDTINRNSNSFGFQLNSTTNKDKYIDESSLSSIKNQSKNIKQIIPIIIVPPKSLSPLIGIHNIQNLFENFKFESSPANNISTSQQQKQKHEIFIDRPKSLTKHDFYKKLRVVEKPLNDLKDQDWKFVVCVFVHGPSWQFKGWPFPGGQSEIFAKMKAIYACYSDVVPNQNITKWNIETFKINRVSRHNDLAAIHRIWSIIDSFVNKITMTLQSDDFD